MVGTPAFEGRQLEFMQEALKSYTDAVNKGVEADIMRDIFRRFTKRFPVDRPWNEQPSQEVLDAVNDDEPSPEKHKPTEEEFQDPEEYKTQMEEYNAYQSLLKKREDVSNLQLRDREKLFIITKQLKRWLRYRYQKDMTDKKDARGMDPVQVLLHRLTGVALKKPRRITARNVWEDEDEDTNKRVADRLEREMKRDKVPESDRMSRWQKIVKEEWDKLSKNQQNPWEAKSHANHKVDLKKWDDIMTSPPSRDPKDIQV